MMTVRSCLLSFLLLILFYTGNAQTHKVFNVGDRVMVSPLSLKDEQYWRAGTVTEVHNYVPKKAYSVACDASANAKANTFVVNEDWIRPLTETRAAQANQTPTPGAARAPQAAPAATGRVACPPSDPDTKGATSMERGLRVAIREGFERKAELNSDGAVTVNIQNLWIGSSHKWEPVVDPQAARGKEIYSVKSDFTTCTDYHTRIVLVKRDRVFKCYKNEAGVWACEVTAAANTNVRDETRSIEKVN